jgi:hypothetical protein
VIIRGCTLQSSESFGINANIMSAEGKNIRRIGVVGYGHLGILLFK